MQIEFKIEYKTVWGERLCLVLGDKKHPMAWTEGGVWQVLIKNCKLKDLKDYSYIVMRDGYISRREWQSHSYTKSIDSKKFTIFDSWNDCPITGCPFEHKHQRSDFDRPGYRGAGTVVPVFSLRSTKDFGIGDFEDLRLVIDWASATGQTIVQLLPVCDTTKSGAWEDSYPYSPVSAFALHPLYIRLQDIGIQEDAAFLRKQKKLNSLAQIDYPLVYKEKMAYIRKAFRVQSPNDMRSSAYKRFCKHNAYWLDEYAQFCAQRDSSSEDFYKWVQYHLDKQFASVAAYARSKGISLKGDLPIGVSAQSADAHWHPELFNLDSTAGAPPDFFSRDGQNWGFPTYNWEAMASDDYAWWKARLRKMAEYFDAYRIDHILGFFRIWEIPVECKSGMYGHFNPALGYTREEIEQRHLTLNGLFHKDPRSQGKYQPLISPFTQDLSWSQHESFSDLYNDFFYHRHNDFWRLNALRKLPALLSATGMLACGEDLGMVPDCVPGVMTHEGILSLKMRGMEKEGAWPQLSVCSTSSHDMETLRMQAPSDPTSKEVRNMLWEFLASPSILAIFPIQDWLALDECLRRAERNEERINQPADPNHHWCYRLHFDLAKLADCDSFNHIVSELIKASDRSITIPTPPSSL